MKKSESKYPIADAGEDFDPESMPDYEQRALKGDFAFMDVEGIRRVYVNEELEKVEAQEVAESMTPPPEEDEEE